MVNQAPRTRKDVSSSKNAEVIQQRHHFLVNGKLVRGAFTRTAEMLDIVRRSVAYIWDTFYTRGALSSNKCAKVGPKPKYSPDDIRNLNALHETVEFESLWDVVHLDEKWFNTDKDRRKVYLVPGETPPQRTWKCKRFIPKVMFLAAIGWPRFDHDRGVLFDGKVGMWPFVESVPAVRNSRNRPASTMATSLVNVNATVYRDYVINNVIPAIKASFPTVSTDGWKFVLRRQPPNSPDLNALDLGFFASIQSLQYKLMSRTVDDVIRSTLAAFEELSYEKLESVFLTFESVMQLILEHDGGNHYVLPHLKKAALRRAGLLMQNVSCPVSLLL
ncbi:hypothetical protein H257_15137 [Aphanomyces astaci]|uniref:Uncharacterized protein n=1 Tax=Aphanomyces astaci TaxID=112090 RepID=W4FNB5_APHAT|nr:hypothetical protein H257_15137 [Aphanomyces astaci]ETV68982.1 hypothetical protein H257_15137 [Aphanomyces astaci]|eukprot:XP_009841441.1 hypothetical protein H257_15137 [Aphanomyces astaci]